MKKIIFILSVLILAISATASVGSIERYSKNAFVLRHSKKITVRKNLKLEVKDIIQTGKNSWVRLRLNDNTIITVGKNSKLIIEDYLYDGKTNAKASFKFSKGVFRTITGAIGKIAPEKFRVRTPNATIGIRGTEFYVDTTKSRNQIICTIGSIVIHSSFGEVEVEAGKQTLVNRIGKASSPDRTNKREFYEIKTALGLNRVRASTSEKDLLKRGGHNIPKPNISINGSPVPNIDNTKEELLEHDSSNTLDNLPEIPYHDPCPVPQ